MIKTPRLMIKPWTEAHTADFYELSRDAGFSLFPITVYRQDSLESARLWIKKTILQNQEIGMGKWSVWETESGKLVGMGGLTPWTWKEENLIDITYRLRESARGKGYGKELALALVLYGQKNLSLFEITATITPNNAVSKAIATKLGFKFDQKIILQGVATDLYRLSKS